MLFRYNGCEEWTRDKSLDLDLLTIDTAKTSLEEGCKKVLEFLRAKGHLNSSLPFRQDDPLFLMSG